VIIVAKAPKNLRDRVAQLEDELKQRDERIKDLRRELNEAEELISEEREHVEQAIAVINSWKEAFNMVQDENGVWQWNEWVATWKKQAKAYDELVTKWNRFVGEYNALVLKRNMGRPLLASEAQVQQVRKLRKAGKSLHAIEEETNLGFQTVRTILSKDTRTDRTTKRHLERINPGRFKEEPWRERTRARLPKRISETLEHGRELVKAAKGLR
jgi:hypothetical protein